MVTTKTNKRENMSLIKNQRNSCKFYVVFDEKIVFIIKIAVFGMLNIYKCTIYTYFSLVLMKFRECNKA